MIAEKATENNITKTALIVVGYFLGLKMGMLAGTVKYRGEKEIKRKERNASVSLPVRAAFDTACDTGV